MICYRLAYWLGIPRPPAMTRPKSSTRAADRMLSAAMAHARTPFLCGSHGHAHAKHHLLRHSSRFRHAENQPLRDQDRGATADGGPLLREGIRHSATGAEGQGAL